MRRMILMIASVVLAVCTSHGATPGDHSPTIGSQGAPFHGGISSLSLMEGGISHVAYCRYPSQGIVLSCQKLSSISSALPNTWPSPTSNPKGECPNPFQVIVNFVDRSRFVYGPCSIPPSIYHLYKAMIASQPAGLGIVQH